MYHHAPDDAPDDEMVDCGLVAVPAGPVLLAVSGF